MGVGLGVVALHGLITAARRLQVGWRWGWRKEVEVNHLFSEQRERGVTPLKFGMETLAP